MVCQLPDILKRLVLIGACLAPGVASAHAACTGNSLGSGSLGVARTIEIDASAGPIFGSLTRQQREPSFLQPKEVVLTFDDGPMPWVTKSILDTLDRHCTKATFFSVGRMAMAYPATVKDVLARGHTLGTHTYSHPYNMPRMKAEAATAEIERGIAAVTTAAGGPIAPFFRFTGLSDSARLLGYLQTRGIATFTVDAVSNDSYIGDPLKLADRTMAELARTKGRHRSVPRYQAGNCEGAAGYSRPVGSRRIYGRAHHGQAALCAAG
ncbi:MAG: polysaccharide deacetylase family protein [Hyphomicrobium sp.]|nr:polysaccharide deacetylase family protein [Hyphomicrobium sp.]